MCTRGVKKSNFYSVSNGMKVFQISPGQIQATMNHDILIEAMIKKIVLFFFDHGVTRRPEKSRGVMRGTGINLSFHVLNLDIEKHFENF